MNILLVGNSETFPNSLEKQLAEGDILGRVLSCSSTELALEISKKISIDVLFIDVEFEPVDSIKVLQDLKSLSGSTYIVFIINPGGYGKLKMAIDSGMDDYIVKPLTARDLIARIRIAIRAIEKKGKRQSPALTYFDNPMDNKKPGSIPVPSAQAYSSTASNPAVSSHPRTFVQERKRSRRKKVSTKINKENRFKTMASLLGNIIFICLMLAAAALAFFLVQSRITGGTPAIAGNQMYIVLSGSMKPAFDTGSLAFVRPVDTDQIAVGDIITFKGASGDKLTTHRVVEILDAEGRLQFVTRGDANDVNDPYPVDAEDVVGRVAFAVPYLGYVMHFAQTKQGLIFLVVIPGVVIFLIELRNIFKLLDEEKRKKRQKKRGSLTDAYPKEIR